MFEFEILLLRLPNFLLLLVAPQGTVLGFEFLAEVTQLHFELRHLSYRET